ncbi:AN1-type domain-containing protein [Psidium guajava]|nr:AN1-type domain-containing protein [Psidium guajava]
MIKKKNRCSARNKRVGLLGFECRCGSVFCGGALISRRARLQCRFQDGRKAETCRGESSLQGR